MCALNFNDHTGNILNLGLAFLKKFKTMYDMDKREIGIAWKDQLINFLLKSSFGHHLTEIHNRNSNIYFQRI